MPDTQKVFKKFLPFEPVGQLFDIGIRLRPLDETRLSRLREGMMGPGFLPIQDSHAPIPSILLLRSLGTSKAVLIRKTLMTIADAQPTFNIAIDTLGKHQELVIDTPELRAMHMKLVQDLAKVRILSHRPCTLRVKSCEQFRALTAVKPLRMPLELATNYRKEFLHHHQHLMYPVTAVGLCLMKMDHITVYGHNRIRLSELNNCEDFSFDEFPFRGIASSDEGAASKPIASDSEHMAI